MQIRGRVAVVTGASEGIGAACVSALAAQGALVAGIARSAGRLEANPHCALAVPGDLCDPAFRTHAIDRIAAHFGRIDILINNAGLGVYRPASTTPMDEVRRMFELNFFAALDLAQLVLPGMRSRGLGALVNVSSIGAWIPLPWLSLYSASKAALSAWTEAMRPELRASGIGCLHVLPGFVVTGFQQNALGQVPPGVAARRASAITPAQCAGGIIKALERDRERFVTPFSGWLGAAAWSLAPSLVERYMVRQMERAS